MTKMLKMKSNQKFGIIVMGKSGAPIKRHWIEIGNLGALKTRSAGISELREARPYTKIMKSMGGRTE